MKKQIEELAQALINTKIVEQKEDLKGIITDARMDVQEVAVEKMRAVDEAGIMLRPIVYAYLGTYWTESIEDLFSTFIGLLYSADSVYNGNDGMDIMLNQIHRAAKELKFVASEYEVFNKLLKLIQGEKYERVTSVPQSRRMKSHITALTEGMDFELTGTYFYFNEMARASFENSEVNPSVIKHFAQDLKKAMAKHPILDQFIREAVKDEEGQK